MKTLPALFLLSAALLLITHFSPLPAQYNPPPPPEQANTGEPPDQQGGQVPPPPGAGDDSVAPPDEGMADADQAPPDQGAPDQGGDANFQTFYDDLSSQGNWVQTDNYGYVWQPNVQDQDWAPYTDGHWVYTDEGWTWVAADDEPWGWATYHYGRWANLDNYGWVWVPGYTWAPAWVSWRYGDGYCGWAPLPPDTFVGIDVGGVGSGFVFHIGGDCDTAYDIGPGYYNFLPVAYLGSRNYRHHFADRNNNFAIIGNTRNVTNIVANNRRGSGRFSRVSAGGPDIATVNAQSRTPIQRVQLARGSRPGHASLSGNRLSVFAPHVNSTNAANFRPRQVSGNVTHAQINSGTSISQPLQVNQRVHGHTATAAQISAAHNLHFSQGSHVATPDVHPTHTFNRPLTTFTRATAGTTGTANPSARSNAAVNHPAVNANANANTPRPESTFTGQGANHHNNEHVNSQAQVHQNVVTPQGQTQQVQQSQQAQQAQQAREARQAQESERRQQQQQQQQQAVREQRHAQAPVQQQQVQHQEVHPQAQPQHQQRPQAPPQHADNHPNSDNKGKNDDNKNQQH